LTQLSQRRVEDAERQGRDPSADLKPRRRPPFAKSLRAGRMTMLTASSENPEKFYGTRTRRRDFRITKARAPTVRADSIQYLDWPALNTKGVATMAMAQTSEQMIFEVDVMGAL
jgi:hypothetical protein